MDKRKNWVVRTVPLTSVKNSQETLERVMNDLDDQGYEIEYVLSGNKMVVIGHLNHQLQAVKETTISLAESLKKMMTPLPSEDVSDSAPPPPAMSGSVVVKPPMIDNWNKLTPVHHRTSFLLEYCCRVVGDAPKDDWKRAIEAYVRDNFKSCTIDVLEATLKDLDIIKREHHIAHSHIDDGEDCVVIKAAAAAKDVVTQYKEARTN